MNQQPVSLAISKADARLEFKKLVASWRDLVAQAEVSNVQAVATAARKYHKYTASVFRMILKGTSTAANSNSDHAFLHNIQVSTTDQHRNDLRFHLLRVINSIEDLSEQLAGEHTEIPPSSQSDITRDVFVVHGHDEGARESVARVIERLKLNSVILNEQRNGGQTIIEKFEAHSDCAFAVVLLTADDEGRRKPDRGSKAAAPVYANRARQNVVLELGFFMGKIGRRRVCALVKGDVEIPSDFDGVVYVPMDDHGAWKTELAKEMKAAGLAVDLNDLHNE